MINPKDHIDKIITGEISIKDGKVELRPMDNEIWMTTSEIARFFNVFISKITSNIRILFRDKILLENEVIKQLNHSSGSIVLYNLDMITALAYRLNTSEAIIFRKWVSVRLTKTALVWKVPPANPICS